MKIKAFILAHNEEKILPYVLRHYQRFAEVTILNAESNDRTVEIAQLSGANIIDVYTGNEINDQIYLDIKNNIWKGCGSDWVIVCDSDEFVYHKDILTYLKGSQHTIYLPRLFNMYSETYPSTEAQIYDEVNMGVDGGSKMLLFNPSAIQEINYFPGCHNANPSGDVRLCTNSEIITMHFKCLSRQHVIERNKYFYSRLSEMNKRYKWGYHYGSSEDAVNADFDDNFERLIKVL